MGDRGFCAGGFAYMDFAICPRCGFKRRVSHASITTGDIECVARFKCDERIKRGNLLYRTVPGYKEQTNASI